MPTHGKIRVEKIKLPAFVEFDEVVDGSFLKRIDEVLDNPKLRQMFLKQLDEKIKEAESELRNMRKVRRYVREECPPALRIVET